MALDAPVFGVGPGNFRIHAPRYATLANARTPGPEAIITRLPNNDWLGVWAERGTIAVCCLILLATLIVRALWRSRATERWRVLVGSATLATLLVMGWFDAVLTQGAPVALAALSLGAVLPLAPQPNRRPLWSALTAAVAATALVRIGLQLWAGHLYTSRPLSLERLEQSATLDPGNEPLERDLAELWIGRGDCVRAAPYVERLRRLYPYDRATQRLASQCPP
jgi:putative inorganic carbon (hco3(-)) transporter